jgi:hypothetical protein
MSWLYILLFLSTSCGKTAHGNYLESIVGKKLTIYSSSFPNDRLVFDKEGYTLRMLNKESIRAQKAAVGMSVEILQEGPNKFRMRLGEVNGVEVYICLWRTHAVSPCTKNDNNDYAWYWEIDRQINGFQIKAVGQDRCVQQKTAEGHVEGTACRDIPGQKFDFVELEKDEIYRDIFTGGESRADSPDGPGRRGSGMPGGSNGPGGAERSPGEYSPSGGYSSGYHPGPYPPPPREGDRDSVNLKKLLRDISDLKHLINVLNPNQNPVSKTTGSANLHHRPDDLRRYYDANRRKGQLLQRYHYKRRPLPDPFPGYGGYEEHGAHRKQYNRGYARGYTSGYEKGYRLGKQH